jgi:Flp pilus assembly protein TadG
VFSKEENIVCTIDKLTSSRVGKEARRFFTDEDGSFTIESVVWMPIFAILIAIIMNVSMVFFGESQMMRVVQDANRAFSLGRFENELETETYILANLDNMDANFTVETTLSGGVITTELSAPAADLMPLNLMTSAFDSVDVSVFAQQLLEY